jgi:hypothetical protein
MAPDDVRNALVDQAIPLATDVPSGTTDRSVYIGPHQAFEDLDHDGIYDAGTDLLIPNQALRDGQYTPNGSRSLVIPAAVGPIATADQIEFRTAGNLTIRTPLSAGSGVRLLADGHLSLSDVALTSDTDQVLLEADSGIDATAATFTAGKEVFIRGQGRMHFPEATLRSTGERIEFDLAGTASTLTLSSATLTAQRDVIITSDADVTLAGASIEAAEERASVHTAGSAIMSHATVDAMKKVILSVGGDITAEGTALTSHNEVIRLISTNATGQVGLQHAALTTPKAIEVEGGGTSGLLSVGGAAFSDNDDTVLITPRCLPVDGVPASGHVANHCDAEDGGEDGDGN